MSGNTAEPVADLTNVTRVYGESVEVRALDDVTLALAGGELAAIVGPSGSGKSTLLGLLGCLDLPSSGRVRIGGQDVSRASDGARAQVRADVIGFVFQQFHLIPHLDAAANVATGLLYRGLSARQRRNQALEALDEVGLADRADHRPVQLSGGEQQRVALARALAPGPSLILADEPTGALDTKNADMVLELLIGLAVGDRSVVMVTHDLEIADRCRRQIKMRDGRVEHDSAASRPDASNPASVGVQP